MDFEIDRKHYLREAILGDHTSFSTQQNYLKFECQESLEAFVTLLSRNFCNILIFSTTSNDLSFSLFQIDLRVANGTL